MKISGQDRTKLFLQGRAINAQLGNIFQNEMDVTIGMIDEEFDQVEAFEAEIQSYKDHLNRLKSIN